VQRAGEVVISDETDLRSGERKAAGISFQPVALTTGAERAIGGRDTAGGIDRQRQRRLSDDRRESAARSQHVDAALEANLVVHVRQEVGLDVDDGAQMRRSCEPGRGHVRLPDEQGGIGQVLVDDRGRQRPVA
jgi:hypothetical protein